MMDRLKGRVARMVFESVKQTMENPELITSEDGLMVEAHQVDNLNMQLRVTEPMGGSYRYFLVKVSEQL